MYVSIPVIRRMVLILVSTLNDILGGSVSLRKAIGSAGAVLIKNNHLTVGDITTMSWWDSLWLNEGFATLVRFIFLQQHCAHNTRC